MIRPVLLLALLANTALAQAPAPAPAAPAAPAEEILRPPEPGRFKGLFQPFRTDIATLSPDGKYLAYSLRDGDAVSVVVIAVDHPEKMTAHVKVVDDNAATPMLAANQREKTPGRINWMRWVSPTRLMVETNQVYTTKSGGGWESWPGTVLAFDADGGNARPVANASDVYESTPDTAAAPGQGSFSSRRDRSPLGRTPDMASAEAPANDPFAVAADSTNPLAGEAAEPEAPPSLGYTGGQSRPRNLRMFDLDPARPGSATLVASGATRDTGNRLLGFFSLDGTTGKLTSLADEFILANTTPRIDRQGRVRLTLANTTTAKFPFAYQYLGPKGGQRARPLDEAAGVTGFSVSPANYFGERAIPVGFDENPDILYYAANQGRDTYGLYSLNLATGQRGSLALENPAYDLIAAPGAGFPDLDILVFDRFTHQLAGVRYENALRTTIWLRPELQSLQAQLEKGFPGRTVTLHEWDEARNRFLVSTEGPADPGAFYIYDRAQGKLAEFVRKAPGIEAKQAFVTLPFSSTRPDGSRLSGLVTAPQQPRMKPIPMVVICPDTPWQRVRSDFQTEVQALADMGFAVVQLNGRGAWGLGRRQREAITAGYDLVQVEDLVATLDQLGQLFAVNPRRVALLGRGHGGFIALRALQDHPDRFRCAIALEAPVDLGAWLKDQRWDTDDVQPLLTKAWLGDDARLAAAPLTRAPEKVTKPVLLLNYPGADGAPRTLSYLAARNLAGKIRGHGGTAESDSLPMDYMRGLPGARAEVFDRIETFLNLNVYDFNVKLRDLKILPDKPK